MVDWKFGLFLVVNAALGWVFFTIMYLYDFAPLPWDFWKWLWVALLYLVVGLVVALVVSALVLRKRWKSAWSASNVFIYRPLTAFMSATWLLLGFTYLLAPNPTLVQNILLTGLVKMAVIGAGYIAAGTTSHAVSQKVVKNYIGVA